MEMGKRDAGLPVNLEVWISLIISVMHNNHEGSITLLHSVH